MKLSCSNIKKRILKTKIRYGEETPRDGGRGQRWGRRREAAVGMGSWTGNDGSLILFFGGAGCPHPSMRMCAGGRGRPPASPPPRPPPSPPRPRHPHPFSLPLAGWFNRINEERERLEETTTRQPARKSSEAIKRFGNEGYLAANRI